MTRTAPREVQDNGPKDGDTKEGGMLVLSRKVGERIWIGEGIIVTVLANRLAQVRVGIEAPANVVILREELADTPRRAIGPRASDAERSGA